MKPTHHVAIFIFLMGLLSSVSVLIFISYSEAAEGKTSFAKNWSECNCKYYGEKILSCGNTADTAPQGLLFAIGYSELYAFGLFDKWAVFEKTIIIPIAYRIGDDKPQIGVMQWDSTKKLASTPVLEIHYKFLNAILEGKRIAIKLSGGPVHIFWKCHNGQEEATKYIEMLLATGLLKSKPSTRPPSTPTVPTPRSR